MPFLQEIFLFTIYSVVLWLLCNSIGKLILRKLHFTDNYAITTSLAYLLGFGILMNCLIILGLLGQFTFPIIIALLVACGILLYRLLIQEIIQLGKQITNLINLLRQSRWLIIPTIFIAIFSVAMYLSCFAPPTERDEISYHLPEANLLVSTHVLQFPLGGHLFYGNIPVFMEIAYGFGIIFGGYSFAHILHYLIFLQLVLFIVGWLYKNYGLSTASWGGVGLFLLTSTVNIATTSLVDTAFMSLEVMGFILFLEWLNEHQNSYLTLSGAMLGLAIAIKYSPLFTVGIVGICFSSYILLIKRQGIKQWLIAVSYFMIPLLLLGGFWYLKNLIWLHNPTYPLLFGHSGYDETQYHSLISAIQDFIMPRTLLNYLLLPHIYFLWFRSDNPLLSLAYAPQSLTMMIAVILLPVSLCIKRQSRNQRLLLGYVIIFSLYWFFVATHQVRFLDTANIIMLILAVITLTQLSKRFQITFITLLLLIGLSGVIYFYRDLTPFITLPEYALNLPKLDYVFGRTTKADYITNALADCGYPVATYLADQQLNGTVLSDWTAWHNSQFLFYVTHNIFTTLPPNLTPSAVNDFVTKNNVKYIYFNQASKTDFANTRDTIEAHYYKDRNTQEDTLLQKSTLIYTKDTCQLYQLN